MKILIATICLYFLPVSIGNANEWILDWSDEFNYEGQPDSSKWGYEEGLVRNNEIGYFTTRLKNVRVENGMLVIEAHKETYSIANYTAGSILTRNRKNFKYGRFEIRAKMPDGTGSHVGIWLDGDNIREVGWPMCGEIGIAEYVGRLPHSIHIYTHYGADPDDLNPTIKTKVGEYRVMKPYNNFHIYAMEWDETQIKYFIDNVQVGTFNLDIADVGSYNPFRNAQNFRLNYSLGGWGGDVDDSVLPQKFEVDYVRVFRKKKTLVAPINLLLQ